MNIYLEKVFYIIEKDSKQKCMLPNDLKLRINVIDQLKQSNFSVANTIKKLHIQKNMHLINKQDFYKDKQKEIYTLFIEELVPVMDNLDHPPSIEEWKKILMLLLMGKI